MVMTSTSASMDENLATFIVKNLLSKDAIVTFVADTELYMFILNGIFLRVKVPFKWSNECWCVQALAGEVGMSSELDNVARSLYNGRLPQIWRRLAPATLKTLGNWMIHFQQRYEQYKNWVSFILAFLHRPSYVHS